jgi:hypothetical protein
MKWNEQRNSITDQWGGAPILIEAVEGRVSLRHSARALVVAPLDGRGVPAGKPQTVSGQNGSFVIELKADPATVWYAITAKP